MWCFVAKLMTTSASASGSCSAATQPLGVAVVVRVSIAIGQVPLWWLGGRGDTLV